MARLSARDGRPPGGRRHHVASATADGEDEIDTVGAWLALVHRHWPPADAMAWDNVGLQVGDPAAPVARVLVALDVTPDVVAEAADGPATLLLAHHPLLFRPLARLTPASAAGRTALAAARAGVAVAAAHTNLDVARDGSGTSDPVAEVLRLVHVAPLSTSLRDAGRVRLVVFVPAPDVAAVVDAVAAAGAGAMGDYDRCTFRVPGTGTFRPQPGADPHVGSVGTEEHVEEVRVETVVPRGGVAAVVAALRAAHPYEEPAFDVLPLLEGAEVGLGVVGDLPAPAPLRDVAATVRDRLPAPHLRVGGVASRRVARVAVVGGSGGSLVDAALAAGADVMVTGDLDHHTALDARTRGLAVLDAGHHATEAAALPAWGVALAADAAAAGLVAQVVLATTATDPWVAGPPARGGPART